MNSDSKAKHTPAPWSVSERTYENSKGAKYLTVDHLVNGSGVEGLAVVYEGCLGEDSMAEMEANARLIAASPEMYELLKSFISAVPTDGTWNYAACVDKAIRIIKKIEQ